MPITPGDTLLNKYRILRLIDEGGMARVWLAEELTFDGRQVAIKEPKAGVSAEDAADLRRRFQQEISLTAALMQARAPNVVPAWTVEPLDGGLLLAMQYMPGGSLEDILNQPEYDSGLPIEQAVAIALDVLQALDALHRLPTQPVHRDVKPSNILFDDAGRALLADFGLAQLPGVSDRSLLAGGSHPATPSYAASEQLASPEPLAPAADIFALGCVLWEMLTGQRYKLVKPGTPPSRLRADTPAWLDRVVMKALAEDPWERWQSAEEMADALRERDSGGRSLAWLGWAGGAVTLMAVLVATLWALLTGGTGAQGDATGTPSSPPTAEVAQATASDTPSSTETSTPTQTSVPSSNTPIPLVNTLPPPTKTPVPSPPTPVPPTDTPVTPTKTPIPLTDTPTRTPAPLPDAVVNTQNANLRTGPGTNYDILDSLGAGTEVEVIGKASSGNWLQVNAPGDRTGWMAESVLQINASLAQVVLATAPPSPTPEPFVGDMVNVPAGDFLMGNPSQGAQGNAPTHTVYLDEFYIDKTEVTIAQYQRCVEAGECSAARDFDDNCNHGDSGKSDHPINCVDWDQAVLYCSWEEKRLPTEAEWEKAARGIDGRWYPWGNELPEPIPGNFFNTVGQTTPVGQYPTDASPYGILDMAGNISEWVADWYGAGYYAVSPRQNPQGPASGQYRVVRGGWWQTSFWDLASVFNRSQHPPMFGAFSLGFRCARSP